MHAQTSRAGRPAVFLALFALFALTFAGAAGAVTLEDQIDRTLPFDQDGEIVLENVNGSITVETWDRDEVHLVIDKWVKASSNDEARDLMRRFEIEIDAGRDRLHVDAPQLKKEEKGWLSWLFGRSAQHRADFHLTVPRRAVVDADSVNGNVSIHGTRGDLKAETVNGRVSVDDVRGEIEVSSVNGRVTVRAARGAVRADTVNGAIDVELVEVTPGARMSFSTVNGGVDLSLPADVATHLDASSTNGGISTDFPVEVRGRYNRKSVSADLNGGGGELKIRTTNGGIKIREL